MIHGNDSFMFLKLHIPDVAPHGAEYGIRKK